MNVAEYSEYVQDLIDRYKAAYVAAHGGEVATPINVEYDHGWVKISRGDHTFQTVRRQELAEMCQNLERRAAEAAMPEPDLSMNDYQALAMRTAMKTDGEKPAPEYLALSLTGEAGEIAEIIKKAVYHGHALSVDALADELGDVQWYLAVMANIYGFDLSEIARRNVEKLKRRYPGGFSEEASRNREE
jgi:NTP pyrophosphatase (non-canonical NTP hydrolase)